MKNSIRNLLQLIQVYYKLQYTWISYNKCIYSLMKVNYFINFHQWINKFELFFFSFPILGRSLIFLVCFTNSETYVELSTCGKRIGRINYIVFRTLYLISVASLFPNTKSGARNMRRVKDYRALIQYLLVCPQKCFESL